MDHIFISYAREDQNQAIDIYNRLKQEHFNPWLDQKNILPGQDWETEIRKAIKDADIFLACLSNNSVQKRGVVQKEFKLALEVLNEFPDNKVYFIPLRFDDCEVPARMAKLQWVDLFMPGGYQKLIDGLSQLLIPQVLQVLPKTATYSRVRSDDFKERGRTEVRMWGEKMTRGEWNWYNLGNAIEDYLEAIKYDPENQHPWTNIAYVYHLIGKLDIVEQCLQRAYKLAQPGPNHPGRNYKNVEYAIRTNSYLGGGTVNRPAIPDWFSKKYADFLSLEQGEKIEFHHIGHYLQQDAY